ncbi:MAG: hypothetical protein VKS61_15590 [Candidatus Sericytochromatia bacterium]|nr:hypothetical protein [Candidatus Sericytochromatia bacterium]
MSTTTDAAETPQLDTAPEGGPEPLWRASAWLVALGAGLGVALVFGLAAAVGFSHLAAWDGPRTGFRAVGATLVGLGLGAWATHRWRAHLVDPTYAFAWLAMVAGLLAGLAPRLLAALTQPASSPLGPLGVEALVLTAALVPALLAGSAQPLLAAGFAPLLPGPAALSARGLTGLGLGVTAASWWWLSTAAWPLAPDAAASVAAFALVGVGVAALACAKKTWEEAPAAWRVAPAAEQAAVAEVVGHVPAHLAVVLALALPIWLRSLEVAGGAGPEARWTVLVLVAAGMTLGVWCAARWAETSPLARLGAVPALTALALLLGAASLDGLAFRLAAFEGALGSGDAAWGLLRAGQALAAAGLVAVPSLGLGLWLALVLGRLPIERLGAGLAAGLALAGALLLATDAPWPLVGGLVAAAAVLALDAVDLTGRHLGWSPYRRLLGLGLAATPLAIWAFAFPEPSWHALTAPRAAEPPATWAALRVAADQRRVALHARDAGQDVTLLQGPAGWELALNGVPTSLDGTRLAAGQLAAHLPLALHPTVRRVCVVGLSDGVAARAAAHHPLDRLEVVEPSGALIRAVAALDAASPPAAGLKETSRTVSEAAPRLWLRRQAASFDLVLVTAPPPGNTPVGAGPSVELFEAVAGSLAGKGVAALELDLRQHDDMTLARALRSLRRVFPHVTLWQTAGDHVLALGRLEPGVFSPEATRDRLATRGVVADLGPLGLDRPVALLMLQLHTAESIESMLRGTELERVARPTLPAAQARTVLARRPALSPYQTDGRLKAGAAVDPSMVLPAELAEGRLQVRAADFKAFARHQARFLPLNETKGLDAQVLREWRRAFPADREAWLAEAERLALAGRFGEAVSTLAAAPGGPRGAGGLEAKLRFSDTMRSWGWLTRQPPGLRLAVEAWERELRRDPRFAADALVRLAALHHVAGDARAEFATAERALALLEPIPGPGAADTRLRLLVAIARTAYWRGDEPRFRRYTEAAVALDPSDAELQGLLRLSAQAFPPRRGSP